MNPKEYTVEGSTEKEYTVKEEARKKKKRVLEEARASSSLQTAQLLRESINGSPSYEPQYSFKEADPAAVRSMPLMKLLSLKR